MPLRCIRILTIALLLMPVSAPLAQGKVQSKDPSDTLEVPRPPPGKWKGLKQIPFALQQTWSFKDKSGFGLGDHIGLSRQGNACSEQLVSAQYHQDIKKQRDATAHFDNCAFEGSFRALDAERDAIDDLLKTGTDEKAARKAMFQLGRMLHAIQDFYAHTNWVELHHLANVPFGAELVVPLWTEEGRQRVRNTQNLVSGYVWWSQTPSQCGPDALTHGQLAKDSMSTHSGEATLSNWNRRGYNAAFTLAQWSTASLLEWAYTRWPTLKTHCGEQLHVVVTPDRRFP